MKTHKNHFARKYKNPNLQNLNEAERKDKMIEILKKLQRKIKFPFQLLRRFFGDSKKSAQFLKNESVENNEQEQKWVVKSKKIIID